MSPTERVARFIVETPAEALPVAALERAKEAILDTVGVALAGSRDPAGQLICQYVRSLGGNPEAGVLGAGFATTAVDAALANGTCAHALDFDDISWTMHGHPSVPVVPAMLALAERQGASGRDALAAYLVGFEVEVKVAAATGLKHYERGWHGTATAGVFGSAAVASRLLGLNLEQARHALGIAASHAGGLRQNFGTMAKPLHAGLAAQAGVRAGLLAQAGFTADRSILEGCYGFLNVIGEDDRDASVLERLGRPWEILDPGVYLKPYAACGSTHRSLDALFMLRQRESFTADDVQEIRCGVVFRAPMMLIHDNPQTALEGKFSMQYCMAAGLLDGQVGIAQFRDEMVQRPEARRLFSRIHMYVDPEGGHDHDANFANVTVKLRDGRELHARAEETGPLARPLLRGADVVAKFRDTATQALPPADVERLRDLILTLDQQPNLRDLMAIACRTGALVA